MSVRYVQVAAIDLEAALNHTADERKAVDTFGEEADIIFTWLENEGCPVITEPY